MSEVSQKNHNSSATHQRPQHSTTLNRRYVKRPEPIMKKSPVEKESRETAEAVKISSFAKCQAENLRRRQELAEKINQERLMAMKEKRLRRGYVAATKDDEPVPAPDPLEAALEEPEDTLAELEAMVEDVENSPEIVENPVEKYVDNSVEKPVENSADTTTIAVSTADDDCAVMEPDTPAQSHPIQEAANARLERTWTASTTVATEPQPSAQQMKDAAIKKAMRSVATMEAKEKQSRHQKNHSKRSKKSMSIGSKPRLILAMASAAAVVIAIGYFVSVNLPDVSVRVTALQSGIENPYPSYIPRGFSLQTSLSSDTGISMTFTNGDKSFTLSEEKSSWDSKALLKNYVEENWRGYDTVKEQGLTIYISGSNAAWVNGGIKYLITADWDTLTSKQIKSIATSL